MGFLYRCGIIAAIVAVLVVGISTILYAAWTPTLHTWAKNIVTVAPVVTAAIFIGSLFVAVVGYRYARHTEKRKLTMQMISDQIHDRDIVKMFDDLRFLRRTFGEEITLREVGHRYQQALSSIGPGAPQHRQPRDVVIQVLNYYETWGVGINADALDETLLKNWWRGSLVADWQHLFFFICEFRDTYEDEKFLVNIERVVMRWANQRERAAITELERRYQAKDYPRKVGDVEKLLPNGQELSLTQTLPEQTLESIPTIPRKRRRA